MEKEQHEQYEYARKRIIQKKRLYSHFVLLVLGNLFLFIAYHFFSVGIISKWPLWVIPSWFFLFILHFIRVYITDCFMNKNWERTQIDRLVSLQQKKIAQLQAQVDEDNTANTLQK